MTNDGKMYVVRMKLADGAVECVSYPKAKTADQARMMFAEASTKKNRKATVLAVEIWN